MADLFRANDVALLAIEIEKRGEKFYYLLSEKAEDSRTRKIFIGLAKAEVKHKKIFEALYERLGEVDLPAWSNEAEFLSYLNALIDTHTLFRKDDLDQLPETIKTRKDAIEMAMGFEKESILVFMEMKEFVPESEKKYIAQCIEEERSHLRLLSEML
ncbi:MAG: ferritin family protein [Deltaproteobacteria bacterium]|nr:ferritin family protein [Deltaproteobacteria bacterium]